MSSGRSPKRHAQGILKLGGWDLVLLGHYVQRLASAEHGERILEPGTPAGEDWLAETATGINKYVGVCIGRQVNAACVDIVVEVEATQVRADHVVEHTLAAADDDQIP